MKNINKKFWLYQEFTFEFGMDKMDKRSSYIILFNSWRWIDLSDIVIHDIDPIRLHRDGIHPVEFTDKRFIISMGLNPEYCELKKNETMKLWK